MKSPLLSGEKLEGVQDALKGFQAANGVLWFHQEAGPGVSAELMVGGKGSGITGRQQVPKYHAKNHGRRDGHALRPEAGVTNPAHPWRKLLGDCWGKCKQIQAVNRTLFTADYYYQNRCIYIDVLFAFICR